MQITHDNFSLYLGDCRDILPSIPEHSVDFFFSDLPYGETSNKKDIIIPMNDYIIIGKKRYTLGEFKIYCFDNNISKEYFYDKWNGEHSKGLWHHIQRVTKPNGCIALYAQGRFYSYLVNSNESLYKYDYCWDKVLKTGFLNANNQPLRQHEMIPIFYKKQPTYNPQMTEGKPVHSRGSKYKTEKITNKNYNDIHFVESDTQNTKKHPSSILKYQKPHPSTAKHRTMKSPELCDNLIKTYTNEGDVVMDCTMGSGTAGLAALKIGRKFIGIEKDSSEFEKTKKYFEIYTK